MEAHLARPVVGEVQTDAQDTSESVSQHRDHELDPHVGWIHASWVTAGHHKAPGVGFDETRLELLQLIEFDIEWLLAQDVLASLHSPEQTPCMEAIRTRDHDGVDVGIPEGLLLTHGDDRMVECTHEDIQRCFVWVTDTDEREPSDLLGR